MKRSKKSDMKDARSRQPSLLKTRFEATIYPGRKAKAKDWADHLGIDRVPGSTRGQVRALITVEDCVRLLDEGLEVRLYRAHPREPLDAEMIEKNDSFKRWLDKKVSSLKANPGPTPFIEPET